MITLMPAVLSAIPSIIKLFSSEERTEGVKELTQTVVTEASKKLGVNFKTKDDVINHINSNPEDALKLRDIETKHIQALSNLKLEDKKEDNRHEEFFTEKELEDRNRASEMFKHGSELQTKIADDIMYQTNWRIPLWISINIALLLIAEEFKINSTVVLAAGNLIGIALKSDYDERASVKNFLFGAMIAKIKK